MTKARDLANIISGGFTADDIPNLDASKITSGSIADARIPESAVSQHATSFDDNKIVNDISTLALRQASNENKGAYNSNSMSVDVFQDDTGIDTETNTDRNASEYVSSAVLGAVSNVITLNNSNYTNYVDLDKISFIKLTSSNNSNEKNNPEINSNNSLSGGSSFAANSIPNSAQEQTILSYMFNSTASEEYSFNNTDASVYRIAYSNFRFKDGYKFIPTNNGNTVFTWISGQSYLYHVQVKGLIDANTGSNLDYTASTLTNQVQGMSNGGTYTNSISNSSNTEYDGISIEVYHNSGNNTFGFNNLQINGTVNYSDYITSATGNFTGTTIIAPSSVSSMGAIITYQDNAGTNALNTDIVLQLSADGGSNYSTATLTALPDFSTGIKMAKVNDLSVTAGTQLKYKILFANQSSGSKEARIRGVSLQY